MPHDGLGSAWRGVSPGALGSKKGGLRKSPRAGDEGEVKMIGRYHSAHCSKSNFRARAASLGAKNLSLFFNRIVDIADRLSRNSATTCPALR
ncbi:hypothetical protein DVDV_3669 [Desulfovibrio sp. DV]|nr:hypothetical protein DVDV_3669 [Desulfovibrio sp. DV]